MRNFLGGSTFLLKGFFPVLKLNDPELVGEFNFFFIFKYFFKCFFRKKKSKIYRFQKFLENLNFKS